MADRNGYEGDAGSRASPWSSPTFIASGLIVGLIAVLAIVLVLTNGDDSTAPGPVVSTPSAPTSSPASAGSGGTDSACGLPPGDQQIPTEAPPTDWELLGKTAVPERRQVIGPGKVEDGFRSCYSRSPVGALFAIANFVGLTANSSTSRRALTELLVPGPGRDAALADAEEPPTDAAIQISGYKIRAYSQDQALIELVFSGTAKSQAVTFSLPYSLKWIDGDWKLDPPQDGEVDPKRLGSLDGYTPWSGV